MSIVRMRLNRWQMRAVQQNVYTMLMWHFATLRAEDKKKKKAVVFPYRAKIPLEMNINVIFNILKYLLEAESK